MSLTMPRNLLYREAGLGKCLKTIWNKPKTREIRSPGFSVFKKRIYRCIIFIIRYNDFNMLGNTEVRYEGCDHYCKYGYI